MQIIIDTNSFNLDFLYQTSTEKCLLVAASKWRVAISQYICCRYDIIDGNQGQAFSIDSQSGALMVNSSEHVRDRYLLHVRASDGKYSSVAQVNIRVEKSENSGLVFQKEVYEGTVEENSTRIATVAVLNVLGTQLNEHVLFSILNPTELFEIGSTSGAISTTGLRFDRETCDKYELVVEAKSQVPSQRVAHVLVNVTVLDINDNCPIFVNLPYYAVVSVDAQKTDVIMKVSHCFDLRQFRDSSSFTVFFDIL